MRPAHRMPFSVLIVLMIFIAPLHLAFAEETTSNASRIKAVTAQLAPDISSDRVKNSVVKIFSKVRDPEHFKPWTKQSPSEVSGSGVIIDGNHILTNAHMVLYASQIQVQANQSDEKITAKVEAIAPGIDLALLTLEDKSFFQTHQPLERAGILPELTAAVMVYGFPRGGSSLSITKGIVSRIEFTEYKYGTSGLRIQIDAAVNSGNSGGPAVVDGKMIGLVFRRLNSAQNIGYIIPCEEIELFLNDIADGKYDGKPAIDAELQTLENPALREFLKLDKSMTGIVVHPRGVNDHSYPLKKWDVITKCGDKPVDNEGMVTVNANLRLSLNYWVQKIAKNGEVGLTIIRDGKNMTIALPVKPAPSLLIPYLQGEYPSYFIYGPFVFSRATNQFVENMSSDSLLIMSYDGNPLITRLSDRPAFEGEELVVVASSSFPHKVTNGYSSFFAEVLKSVNGIPIKNLKHLVEVLRTEQSKFVSFEFYGKLIETKIFVREEILSSTKEILADNNILSQGSAELMNVWDAGKH